MEDEIRQYNALSGKMNMIHRSLEIMLDQIFKKADIICRGVSFGDKLKELNKCSGATWVGQWGGDFADLFERLEVLNKEWNTVKHGTLVGGTNVLVIERNGRLEEYSSQRIQEIDNMFSKTQKELIFISKLL